MFLLIDAGNTRIKWALVATDAAPGAWLAQAVAAHGALDVEAIKKAAAAVVADEVTDMAAAGATADIKTADSLQIAVIAKIPVAGTGNGTLPPAAGTAHSGPVQAIWIANVAGADVRSYLQQVLQAALPGVPLNWFASSSQACGLENGYREPTQLGCDRFAAAIGARRLFPQQALLVANCGTATTLDAISAVGRFIGGMILPGLGTMAHSLNRQTAQLPPVEYSRPGVLHLADNTEQAIISGCIAAQIGAMDHGLRLLRSQSPPVLCILTGGAAQVLGAAWSEPHQVIANLVLHGLQAVAQQALLE